MRRKLTFGVGVNDADYPTRNCPYYKRWYEMFRRCYSTRYQTLYPTYIGCYVREDWHYFSRFKAWMMTQDWEGKQLDKDILFEGNKVYSEETCVFVSDATNKFLTDAGRARGLYPIGVHLHDCGRFKAQVNIRGNGPKHLGLFDTADQAHTAWKKAKHNLAIELASKESDIRIVNSLLSMYSI